MRKKVEVNLPEEVKNWIVIEYFKDRLSFWNDEIYCIEWEKNYIKVYWHRCGFYDVDYFYFEEVEKGRKKKILRRGFYL